MSSKISGNLIEAADLIARPIFSAPWEARVFAVAVALCEKGKFEWPEFQQNLIEEIGAAERNGEVTSGGTDYYQHWLAALTRLLDSKGIVEGAELDARVAEVGPPPPPQDPRGKKS